MLILYGLYVINILLHDYNLCFNGFLFYSVGSYNYIYICMALLFSYPHAKSHHRILEIIPFYKLLMHNNVSTSEVETTKCIIEWSYIT